MRAWRHIWLRRRFPRREHRAGSGLFLASMLGVGLAVLVISCFDAGVRPVLIELAKAKTSNAVMKIVNDAVNRTMAEQAIAYDDMITLQTDSAGQITALTSNSVEMNRLRGELLSDIVRQVDVLDRKELGIPIGNLTGFSTLSNTGPMLPVSVLSVASADATFRNQFNSVGINQSHHQIVLDVTVNIKLLIPGGTVTTTVDTEVSVAETVIVGKVPDAYLQFDATAK